ncbi:MAG: hypothetical protein QOG30_318, partial [Acidimicrobiaceae bacterium]
AGNGRTKKFEAVAAPGSTISSQAAERATSAAAGSGTAGTFSVAGRPALGTFTDRSALATAAQTEVHSPALNQSKAADTAAPTAGAAGPPSTTTPTCLVPPPPDAANEVYAASAELEGRAVQVDVFTIADGSLVLVVTDAATCEQVFSQPV